MADLTHEELVERVARKICDVWGYEWDGDPDHEQTAPDVTGDYDERPSKELFRIAAESSISTIAEALREPTEEMMMAMIYAKKLMWPIVGQVLTVEYRAAIAASPLHGAKK